ncbi:MAG: DUF5063 domain-containing protein [Bacteroidales bacterium]|nr:DUF5063 domain-containing protein [Bacteroidales bacterium]
MADIEEKVKGSHVIELITVANDFCIFTEGLEKYDKSDILGYFQKVLPLLYIKGALTPYVPPVEDMVPEHYITEENWDNIYSQFKEKLGEDDMFGLVIHDEIYGDKAEKASIAEGLADIYQDLKDFLVLYQQNTSIARQNAVYECHRLFAARWGHRLVNVHAAIHKLLFSSKIENNTLPGQEI